jgi:DNA-binding NarL/FixJ family response regulator
MISVLIADDQDLVREGLRMLLEAEPDLAVTGEAADGNAALTQARLLDPDVILMDVRMPAMNGIEATTRLVKAGSRARILMLTTFHLDEYVYRALKAGASGFLLKDASRDQLTGAVRAVAAGETLLAPAVTRRLIEDFCSGPAPGTEQSSAAGLSERELGVVRLVAQGLSNAEIAAGLYLSEATVKSHVARILARLGLRDRVQVAVYAYEHGIVRPGHGTHLLGPVSAIVTPTPTIARPPAPPTSAYRRGERANQARTVLAARPQAASEASPMVTEMRASSSICAGTFPARSTN